MEKKQDQKKRTREELDAFLWEDYDQENDGQELYQALVELAKEDSSENADIDRAWKDFREFYYPQEKKSAKKKASYWKWLAAAAILCVVLLASNGDVRAQVKEWMNQWALRAGISYDKHVSPYEKEVNLELKNGDYTLFVYTIGQTSTACVVEYRLEDKNGEIVPGTVVEAEIVGITKNRTSTSLPPRKDENNQRVAYLYGGGEDVDLTTLEGVPQKIRFTTEPTLDIQFENGVLIDNTLPDMNLEFEAEIVLDRIFPKTTYQVNKDLKVKDFTIYVEEVVDEGIYIRVRMKKPNMIHHSNEEFVSLNLVMQENGEWIYSSDNSVGFWDQEGDPSREYVWFDLYYNRPGLPSGEFTLQALLNEDWTGLNRKEYDVYGDKIMLEIP